MTERVMIDIETLGLDPGAAILSIGAVRFGTDGIGSKFYDTVNLESCQDAGLLIDAGTLEWWLNQDEAARDVLTDGEADIETVLQDFSDWYEGEMLHTDRADEIWANSPSFDCAILAHAYEQVGMEPPWEFYEERDVRTLKELPVAVDRDHDGTNHDALDDAVHQARVASDTLSRLIEVEEVAEDV